MLRIPDKSNSQLPMSEESRQCQIRLKGLALVDGQFACAKVVKSCPRDVQSKVHNESGGNRAINKRGSVATQRVATDPRTKMHRPHRVRSKRNLAAGIMPTTTGRGNPKTPNIPPHDNADMGPTGVK